MLRNMMLWWSFHGKSILIVLLCCSLWSRTPLLATRGTHAKTTSDIEIRDEATLQSNLDNVTGWKEPNPNGNPSTPLSLLFSIVSKGPKIAEQPSNTIVDWGRQFIRITIVD